MKKINVKQRSLGWYNLRATRIGASEAWGILRYYATEQELLNVGIDPLEAKQEVPYSTSYRLYKKMIGTPEDSKISIYDAQFGEAMEFWVKSKFTSKPSSNVYIDKNNIVSLDIAGGSGAPWVAPIIEIKTRREIADKPLLSWRIQMSLQCRAEGSSECGLLQIALFGFDEVLRGRVGFAYEKLNHKKFLEFMENLEKEIVFDLYQRDDRLLALYDVCMERFLKDVSDKNPPIPVIAEEPTTAAIGELIGSYTGQTEYNLKRYLKLKRLGNLIKDELDKEKQSIFVKCINTMSISVFDEFGNSGKFNARSFLTKEAK